MKKIILCIDFSDDIDAVITRGIELENAFDSVLILLYIAFIQLPVGALEDSIETIRFDIKEDLQHKRKKLNAKNYDAKNLLIEGLSCADIVKQQSEELDADLIIVGSKGHGTIAGSLIGSFSQSLSNNINRSILVVPN